MKHQRVAWVIAASMVLSACGGNATSAPKLTVTNPAAAGKLQVAVGTANIYNGAFVGLNVVSTFRQTNGRSAVGADTPTITGPYTLPAVPAAAGAAVIDPFNGTGDQYSTLPGGPSVEEVAGKMITGTPQTTHPGTPTCDSTSPCTVPGLPSVTPNTSTFGITGGVFGMGLQPANSTINTVAASYVPYLEPLYDTSGNTFYPYCGPPACDPDHNGMGTRDGLWNLSPGGSTGGPELGVLEGLTTFESVTPATGTYTLNVVVQVQGNGGGVTSYPYNATASLSSAATLGGITLPASPLTLDGNGGASITIPALPAGVTEAYLQITDIGPQGAPTGKANCQGALGTAAYPVFYTIEVTGAGTYTLPDTDGPNTNTTGGKAGVTPSPSICTAAQNAAAVGAGTPGDTVTVQAIGFDYPAYEMTYFKGSSQTPALTGANGQADITISAPVQQTST